MAPAVHDRTAVSDLDKDGAFKREQSGYREHVKKGTRFEPEGASRSWLRIKAALQPVQLELTRPTTASCV